VSAQQHYLGLLTVLSVLITGPSANGIGAETATALAAGQPKLIILAGRNESKIQPVIDLTTKVHSKVSVRFLAIDFAAQSSIREAVKQLASEIESLDILINNAGSKSCSSYPKT